MSIEIRCNDGHFECHWGRFGNTEIDTRRPIEHLILAVPDVVSCLLEHGPQPGTRGGTMSCTEDKGRTFCHLEYDGNRWTWELFDAHWWDNQGPVVLIGRWPD